MEISRMWHMKASVSSVVVGTLDLIGKCSDRQIEGVLGSPCLEEIQKIILTNTAHILWRAFNLCKICKFVGFLFYTNMLEKMSWCHCWTWVLVWNLRKNKCKTEIKGNHNNKCPDVVLDLLLILIIGGIFLSEFL